MSYEIIGVCSLCGGDVQAFRGAWLGVTPPPPGKCTRCGAVEASSRTVIPMVPMGRQQAEPCVTFAVASKPIRPDTFGQAQWRGPPQVFMNSGQGTGDLVSGWGEG